MLSERQIRNVDTELTIKVTEDLKKTKNAFNDHNKESEREVVTIMLQIQKREEKLRSLQLEDREIEQQLKYTINRLKMFDHILRNISV